MKKGYISIYVLLFAFLSVGSSSCKFIFGIKKPQAYSDAVIKDWSKDFTSDGTLVRLDTTAFFKTYDSLRINDKSDFKDLCQPMHIIVFNKEIENITHLINCNVGGVPLKWNHFGSFDKVPLLANGILEPTYKVNFIEVSQYVEPRIDEQEVDRIFAANDYVYVVIFTRAFYGVTKGMFHYLDTHKKLLKEQGVKAKFIYVFAEDLYLTELYRKSNEIIRQHD